MANYHAYGATFATISSNIVTGVVVVTTLLANMLLLKHCMVLSDMSYIFIAVLCNDKAFSARPQGTGKDHA